MKFDNQATSITWKNRFAGWLIHMFTASGAYVGVLSLFAIYQQKFSLAIALMFVTILIDAVDGMFARIVHIKEAIPKIDGALLDNIVDFFNYTIVPVFFLLVAPMVPAEWKFPAIAAVIFSSAYQFTQIDAKTSDHFFKGFPSYWNIVVFYLYFWQTSQWTNLWILLVCALLSFVPIKYIYPSRLDYLTHHKGLRYAMLLATVAWGVASAGLLWDFPATNHFLSFVSMGYLILYVTISLYRTWVPLRDYAMHGEPIIAVVPAMDFRE